MEVRISETFIPDYGVLCCASCGSPFLHHIRAEAFSRMEDSETGFHIRTQNLTKVNSPEGEVFNEVTTDWEASIDMNMAGNPSARRSGVLITFYCEECEDLTVLSIFQHKGNTLLETEVLKKDRS